MRVLYRWIVTESEHAHHAHAKRMATLGRFSAARHSMFHVAQFTTKLEANTTLLCSADCIIICAYSELEAADAELDLEILQKRLSGLHASLSAAAQEAEAVAARLTPLRHRQHAEVKRRASAMQQALRTACVAISSLDTRWVAQYACAYRRNFI